MSGNFIEYRSGYKYQLASDYHLRIAITPAQDIDTQFIALDTQGNLVVKSGYAWDGTSGPVIDTGANLRASLVHDALYQLMRLEAISADIYKDNADKLFSKMCREDGVLGVIAQVYYATLKVLARPATDPKNKKLVERAPEGQ